MVETAGDFASWTHKKASTSRVNSKTQAWYQRRLNPSGVSERNSHPKGRLQHFPCSSRAFEGFGVCYLVAFYHELIRFHNEFRNHPPSWYSPQRMGITPILLGCNNPFVSWICLRGCNKTNPLLVEFPEFWVTIHHFWWDFPNTYWVAIPFLAEFPQHCGSQFPIVGGIPPKMGLDFPYSWRNSHKHVGLPYKSEPLGWISPSFSIKNPGPFFARLCVAGPYGPGPGARTFCFWSSSKWSMESEMPGAGSRPRVLRRRLRLSPCMDICLGFSRREAGGTRGETHEDLRKAGRKTRRETGGKQGGKRGKQGKQGKVTSSWEAKGEPEKNKNQRTREPGKREENREETRGKQGGN